MKKARKGFIKNLRNLCLAGVSALGLITIVATCGGGGGSSGNNENQLEYVSPEEVGYSSEKLEEARDFAEQSGYAAVMALYDGKVFSIGAILKRITGAIL